MSREEVLFRARREQLFVVINQLMTPTSHSARGENTKKRAATIICTLLLLSALMALSSVILVEKERTRNYYDTFEKGKSGRKSAFRFLDSIMKGKKKALSEKKKGFKVDVVEDDQMGGDLIVVKEDNQEEEGL